MSIEGHYEQCSGTVVVDWRVLTLRGMVALSLGLVVLPWPDLVPAEFAHLFGLYALVDAAITIGLVTKSPDRSARTLLPMIEIAVGAIAVLVLAWPARLADGFVYVIAGWALATGALKILTAILPRANAEDRLPLAGSGVLSVLFVVLVAVLGGSDVPFLAPVVGAFAVAVSLALIVFAFRSRERKR